MDSRELVSSWPVLGGAARAVRRFARARHFTNSSNYWEQRYQQGDTSGAGSYGRLAEFKADFLNRFVADHDITSVVELGSGDGAQLMLADYPNYTGVDVAATCVELCRRTFEEDGTKRFVHSTNLATVAAHDLALSLDVIFHLVEDEVFDSYMQDLFRLATRYVIVYASNINQATSNPHVRHRQFVDWVGANQPDWSLTERVPNRYRAPVLEETDDTSSCDFFVFTRI